MSKDAQLFRQILEQKIEAIEQQIQAPENTNNMNLEKLKDDQKRLQEILARPDLPEKEIPVDLQAALSQARRKTPTFYSTTQQSKVDLLEYWKKLGQSDDTVKGLMFNLFFPADQGILEFRRSANQKLIIGRLFKDSVLIAKSDDLLSNGWQAPNDKNPVFSIRLERNRNQTPDQLAQLFQWLLSEIYELEVNQKIQVTVME